MNKIVYSENYSLLDYQEIVEIANDMAYWGHTKEVLEQARELNVPNWVVAEAGMGVGNSRDDDRFLKHMREKALNKKPVEDIRHHQKSTQNGFAIIRDVAEHWVSHFENWSPQCPSYRNPDRIELIELNKVPIKQLDNVSFKRGHPKYRYGEDKLLYKELLIELRNGDHHWIRILPWTETNSYWIYTKEKERQMIIQIHYNQKQHCYQASQGRKHNPKTWLRSNYKNIHITGIYPATPQGYHYKIVNEDEYYHKDPDRDINPFQIDEHTHHHHWAEIHQIAETLLQNIYINQPGDIRDAIQKQNTLILKDTKHLINTGFIEI